MNISLTSSKRKLSIIIFIIGIPFIGIRGLGKIDVNGINLSPFPPAIIKIEFFFIFFYFYTNLLRWQRQLFYSYL